MVDIGPLAVEWLPAGAFVTVLRVLMSVAGWTWLLAGYSEASSPVPDDVVRAVAGNTVLRVGLAVLAVGALVSVTDPPSSLGPLVGAVIVVAVGRLVYRLNTWSAAQGSRATMRASVPWDGVTFKSPFESDGGLPPGRVNDEP